MAQTPDPKEMRELRNTVELMDALSQEAFAQISAIAKLAVWSLESPDGYQHIELVANALKAIWGQADDALENVNRQADLIGCSYLDRSERRRLEASSEAHARRVAHAHKSH